MAAVRAELDMAILGAGPTGLGAAHRLVAHGHQDWRLFERAPEAGGLAASVTDEAGYTWDLGCHVQHSHYQLFDELMEELLGHEWQPHRRETWVQVGTQLVPYPFQHSLHLLPDDLRARCQRDLAAAPGPRGGPPRDFHAWILASFGAGIAEAFMLPYNRKVWACPPDRLGTSWVRERVAPASGPGPRGQGDHGWGPNAWFRYPARGGAGEPWRRLAARLPPARLQLGRAAVAIDLERRRLQLADGEQVGYRRLISTLPLDQLLHLTHDASLVRQAGRLRHASVHVLGLGLTGAPPARLAGKTWVYFPDPDLPFHRVTLLSRYAPANLPAGDSGWSLLAEVSEDPDRPGDGAALEGAVVDGLVAAGVLTGPDQVVHLWRRRLEHGYPTPFLGRDRLLEELTPRLEAAGVYSRGRFGAWRYEVSNQDHSFMQGVEVVDRLLLGSPEPTLETPELVNRPGRRPAPPLPRAVNE